MKNIRQGYTSRFELAIMQMHIEVDKQKIYLYVATVRTRAYEQI